MLDSPLNTSLPSVPTENEHRLLQPYKIQGKTEPTTEESAPAQNYQHSESLPKAHLPQLCTSLHNVHNWQNRPFLHL